VAGIVGLIAVGIPAIAFTIAKKPGNPALLIVGIVFALKGNKWWEGKLTKDGYSCVGTIQAKSPAEAVAGKL